MATATSMSLPPAPPAPLLDIESLPSLEKFDSQVCAELLLHQCTPGEGVRCSTLAMHGCTPVQLGQQHKSASMPQHCSRAGSNFRARGVQ